MKANTNLVVRIDAGSTRFPWAFAKTIRGAMISARKLVKDAAPRSAAILLRIEDEDGNELARYHADSPTAKWYGINNSVFK